MLAAPASPRQMQTERRRNHFSLSAPLQTLQPVLGTTAYRCFSVGSRKREPRRKGLPYDLQRLFSFRKKYQLKARRNSRLASARKRGLNSTPGAAAAFPPSWF
jgi:hypothetical protein